MTSTSNEEPPPTTIKFNVGGRIYEVSKSLLEGFPDSLLAEKASSCPSSPIFIDRDPDRFAFILDYMRDNGSVHLPETLPKSAFIRELEFFGFGIDDSKISDDKSQQNSIARFHHIRQARQQRIARMEKEAKALEQDLARRKEEINIEKVVLKCFVKSATVENTNDRFLVNYEDVEGLRDVEEKQYFVECCEKLALTVEGYKGSTAVYVQMITDNDRGNQEE